MSSSSTLVYYCRSYLSEASRSLRRCTSVICGRTSFRVFVLISLSATMSLPIFFRFWISSSSALILFFYVSFNMIVSYTSFLSSATVWRSSLSCLLRALKKTAQLSSVNLPSLPLLRTSVKIYMRSVSGFDSSFCNSPRMISWNYTLVLLAAFYLYGPKDSSSFLLVSNFYSSPSLSAWTSPNLRSSSSAR